MKTLSIAMALALTSGAAQAVSVFEVPINGGIARILLDDIDMRVSILDRTR